MNRRDGNPVRPGLRTLVLAGAARLEHEDAAAAELGMNTADFDGPKRGSWRVREHPRTGGSSDHEE